MKVAAVDALKKCCSTFGIGLHLYDGDTELDNRQTSTSNNGHHNNGHHPPPPQDDPYSPDWEPPPREQGPEKYEFGDDPAPATSKQIVALQNIAKSNKTDPDLKDEINRKLKTPPPDGGVRVSKKEASDLISKAFGEK